MTEVVVYGVPQQAQFARRLLAAGCAATSTSARLEIFATGTLFHRLRSRQAPLPDLVLWFGPYAAQAAAWDGFLAAHEPPNLPPRAVHDREWRWTAVDFQPFRVFGSGQPVATFDDLSGARRLAVPDPERSESGVMLVLGVLDRARQMLGDVEHGWTWWRSRLGSGMRLAEHDAGAVALVGDGRASHALSLGDRGEALSGLAPIPHAIGLAASAREPDAAKHLLNWLLSAESADATRWSAWSAAGNGLEATLQAAPPLDIAWATRAYSDVRRRWAQSAFGPSLD